MIIIDRRISMERGKELGKASAEVIQNGRSFEIINWELLQLYF